jgi:hypothetical protein
MRDQATSNVNANKGISNKSTFVKAGSTFTSPRMVADPQSSLSLPNRPRIVSVEFHSSSSSSLSRTHMQMPLLPRNLSKLSKKLVDEHQAAGGMYGTSPMDRHSLTPVKKQEIRLGLCIRPKLLDARSLRALGLELPLSPLSSINANANTELPLRPRAVRPNKQQDETRSTWCFTPVSSFGNRNHTRLLPSRPPVPPVHERSNESYMRSPTMPRELFVPDDF